MKRRKIPNAIRFYEIKNKASNEYLYSEILLYHAFQNEARDLKEAREDANVCEEMYLNPETPVTVANNENSIRNSNIIKVRGKVMPFLLDVEEAREQITVMHMERAPDRIDAEIVQDKVECANLEEEIHPDYETQHPDFYAEKIKEPKKNSIRSHQKITLIDKEDIRKELQKLDPDQRYVVDMLIRFARFLSLRKKEGVDFQLYHLW